MKISQRILLSALFIPHFITAQCPNRPNASLRLLTNDICFGSSVTAINSSDENGNDVYYIWEWGDNTRDTVNDKSSKTHTYNQPINFCTSVSAGGIDYKITLKMVNRNLQCFSHASTSEVFIYAPPQTNFTFDDVCIFNPIVSFKDATCPTTNRDAIYTWDFGDPPSGVNNTSNVVNPKHTYPGIGNYSVKLTVSTFCGERTMIKKIRVLSDPIAQVSYTEQPLYCLPYDITFNNTSLNGTGNTWQVTPDVGYIFTNGTDKTSQNPTFRFLKKGDYKVALTVASPCGTQAKWESKTITVRGKPTISLDTINGICIPYVFTPVGKLLDDGGIPPQYQWTFNNNGQVNTATMLTSGSVTFPNSGASSVEFKATNTCGEVFETQTMQLAGTLNITFPNFKQNLCNIDSVTTLKGAPAGGNWKGIGITAGGIFKPKEMGIGSYSFTYAIAQGTCRDSQTVKVNVLGTTVSAGEIQEVCNSNKRHLILRGGIPTGGTWSGRGVVDSISGRFDPSVAGVGVSNITYTYRETTAKCPNTDSKIITIHAAPKSVIDTALSGFCSNSAKTFTHKAQGAVDFKWLFGDGDSSSLETPIRAYAQQGSYDLKLIVKNFQNCYDTAFKKIDVLTAPLVKFAVSKTEGCTPLSIILNNTTLDNNTAFSWDFGNGSTSNQRQPGTVNFINTTDKDTTYKIFLSATIAGCPNIKDSAVVTVIAPPKAIFGADVEKGCSPLSVKFNNISKGSPRAYKWSFGNGTTSTQIIPTPQIFTTDSFSRTYTIKLIASNVCRSDSTEKTVTVNSSLLRPFFSVSQAEGCAPLAVNFTNYSSSGTAVTYDFGDGNRYTNPNPTYIFEKAGVYSVTQFASGGCGADSIKRTISVYPNPKAQFSYLQNNACHDYRVQFKSTDLQGVNLLWDFGDSTQNDSNNPLHDFKKVGTFKVLLKAETIEYGCKNADSAVVEVKSPLKFKIDSVRDSRCYGVNSGSIVIRRGDVTGGALKYEFALNDSTFKEPNITGVFANLKGRQFYTVWVRDTANCKDFVRVFIDGRLPLSIDAGPTREVDLGDSVLIFLQGNVRERLKVQWQPPVGVSCPTCEQTFIRPLVSTIYTINATDSFGCKERIFLTVGVNTKRRIYIPNVFSPNDDGFNDVFFPSANLSVKQVNYLRIFNRWGQLVHDRSRFQPDDRSAGWDGKFKGNALEADVFVYVMEVELINGEIEILKGDLTLVR